MRYLILFTIALLSVSCQNQINLPEEVHREGTEWCQIHIPKATDYSHKRILFVGDSITNAYYSQTAKALADEAVSVKFVTSASVADPAFHIQLESVLNGYSYDLIHFNNGLHGFSYNEEEYMLGYRKALNRIQAHSPKAPVILALSTALKVSSELDHLNPQVFKRNKLVSDYAKENGYFINDLFKISYKRDEFYSDPYHYHAQAVKLQSNKVVKTILPILK